MKKLLIVIILFSVLIIHSEELYQKFLDEGDYYRAVGAYKEYAFKNNLTDSSSYYLNIAAIYAMSDFINIADEMYMRASYEVNTKEDLKYASLINSYLLFRNAYYDNAIMELKAFIPESDTLLSSLEFMAEMISKEDKIYFVPKFLPDSVFQDLEKYITISLKDPQFAIIWSNFIPGLGELYAGDYVHAIRDFTINTIVMGLTVYALLKNRRDFSIDPFHLTWDYFKTRDWILVYFLYSTFVTRFKNGSMINSEKATLDYNEKLYKEYLTRFYNYIDSLFKKRIMVFIL